MNPLMDDDTDDAPKPLNKAVGSGQRFASLKAALAKRSGIKNPGALASFLGKKKKAQQLPMQGNG